MALQCQVSGRQRQAFMFLWLAGASDFLLDASLVLPHLFLPCHVGVSSREAARCCPSTPPTGTCLDRVFCGTY